MSVETEYLYMYHQWNSNYIQVFAGWWRENLKSLSPVWSPPSAAILAVECISDILQFTTRSYTPTTATGQMSFAMNSTNLSSVPSYTERYSSKQC